MKPTQLPLPDMSGGIEQIEVGVGELLERLRTIEASGGRVFSLTYGTGRQRGLAWINVRSASRPQARTGDAVGQQGRPS
jgi:hypothetical protein